MAKAKKGNGVGIKIPRNALAAGRKAYQDDPNGSENLELPPGSYIGAIVDARGVDTKNGPQLVLDVKIGGEDCDSEYLGGKVGIWFSFDEERVVHLFRLFSKLGYEVEDLDDDLLKEITSDIKANKPVVSVRANSKGFCNIKSYLEDESYEDLGFSDGKKSKKKKSKKDDSEDEGDELDELNRKQLKKFISEGDLEVKIKKSMDDDALRDAIREAMEEE